MQTANVLILCAKTVAPADAAFARGCGVVASSGWARQTGGTQYRVGVKAGLCRNGRVWKGRGDVYTGSKQRGTHPRTALAGSADMLPFLLSSGALHGVSKGLGGPWPVPSRIWDNETRRGQMLPGGGEGLLL